MEGRSRGQNVYARLQRWTVLSGARAYPHEQPGGTKKLVWVQGNFRTTVCCTVFVTSQALNLDDTGRAEGDVLDKCQADVCQRDTGQDDVRGSDDV